MEHLTVETFKSKIYDFEKNAAWTFVGTKPAIIDFYAEWCGPCKAVSSVIERVAKEYEGKIDVYKIDIDDQPELAKRFDIRSIPTLLFLPVGDYPVKKVGAIPDDSVKKLIKTTLKIE